MTPPLQIDDDAKALMVDLLSLRFKFNSLEELKSHFEKKVQTLLNSRLKEKDDAISELNQHLVTYKKFNTDAEKDIAELMEELSQAKEHIRTVKFTIVYTIKGLVEGLPTNELNYLQRVRELVDSEKERDQLKQQLLLANDAAAKGEVGRNMGTALEECLKENVELKRDVAGYRGAIDEIVNRVCGSIKAPAFDVPAGMPTTDPAPVIAFLKKHWPDYKQLLSQALTIERMRKALEWCECYCSTGSDGSEPCPRCKALTAPPSNTLQWIIQNLKDIELETNGYIDGEPDASEASKLANIINQYAQNALKLLSTETEAKL